MPGLQKLLTATSLALLVAGAAGVVTHRQHPPDPTAGAASRSGTPAPATAPASTAPGPATTLPEVPSVPPGPVATSAQLAGNMLDPTDMGGYYHVYPSVAAATLASAPCLAGLGPSKSQAGRAETALLGPDLHSLPTFVEVVASYPGQAAASVYQEVVAAVDACPRFAVTFGGTPLAVPLVDRSIPPVGLASSAWAGTVPYAGSNLKIQVGTVLDGHSVVALLWIDSVPPEAAIMGGFTSTLSAALGKLA